MNVFDLLAKIKLDTKEFDSALGGIPSKIGKLSLGIAKSTAKAAGAVVAGATAGVTALTKQAVGAYAQYEQLEGGIKTLYGSSDKAYNAMMKNAKNAFSDAGMSANEYMATAIESSGTLIRALDGDVEKASEVMNTAIIDMADNANKLGTSMEDIQNAYRGFSRENYTMLDNLSLGYSGTADGMVELIKDSGLLGAEADKLTAKNLKEKVSYDQIIEAIHITQERMGIAGTTYKEAATTIEGSLRSTKAAWTNVLTTLSSGNVIEMGKAVDGLVKAIVGDKKGEGLLNQLKPAVTNAIRGVGELISKAAPIINEQLPVLMREILPPLTEAVASLIKTAIPVVAEMLPDLIATLAPVLIDSFITLISALIKELPTIFASLKEAFGKLFYSIVEALDETFPGLGTMIAEIVKALEPMLPVLTALVGAWGAFKVAMNIADKVKEFKKSAEKIYDFFTKFGGGIAGIGSKLTAFGTWITGTAVPAIGALLSAAAPVIPIIAAIAAAIGVLWAVIANWDSIKQFLTDFGDAFVEAWAEILDSAGQFLTDFGNAFTEAWSDILNGVGEFLSGLWSDFQAWGDSIVEFWAGVWKGIGDKISEFKDAVAQKWEEIKNTVSEKWERIKSIASEKWNSITSTIHGIVDGFKSSVAQKWEEIKATASEKWEALKATASEKWGALKSTVVTTIDNLKSNLAQKWEEIKATASEKWEALKATVASKAESFKQTAIDVANAFKSGWKSIVDKASEWGSDFMSNLASGIEKGKSWVTSKASAVAGYFKNLLGHSHPTEGPMADDYKWMPDMMALFAEGIYGNMYKVKDATSALATAMQPDMPEYNATVPSSKAGFNAGTLAGVGGDIVIPIYLPDGDLWQEIVVNAQTAYDYRSGGR